MLVLYANVTEQLCPSSTVHPFFHLQLIMQLSNYFTRTIVLAALIKTSTLLAAAAPIVDEPPEEDDGDHPAVLIGDLVNPGPITPIGQSIANILLGIEDGQSNATAPRPDAKACKTDPCCVWYKVAQDLTDMFRGSSGRCNNNARAAIRLGFHDAGTWSKKLAAQGQDYGGADGSFILFDEITRAENRGLEDIAQKMKRQAKKHGVGVADLIQFAANTGTVLCPLGPRVRTFVGRDDATQAAPDGLLPDVHADADSLIALFEDKTIDAHALAALVGAHSTSKQFHVDESKSGAPQDTTPAVWDVKFYNETLQPNPGRRVFKFDSDVKLAAHPQISDEWNKFVNSQDHWNEVRRTFGLHGAREADS